MPVVDEDDSFEPDVEFKAKEDAKKVRIFLLKQRRSRFLSLSISILALIPLLILCLPAFSDSMNLPPLRVALWTNESSDGLWNFDSLNWMQDDVDYAYKDGVQVVFGDEGSGTVTIEANIAPQSVLVDSSADYTISCSKLSNSTVEKNSPRVMSSPSQNFLMVTMETSLRLGSIMLYAVDGVTPERYASSLILILRSSHSCLKRVATISLTLICLTSKIW